MKSYLIIGNCGVGKTYVMRKLISNMVNNKPQKLGQIYFHREGTVAILGKYEGGVFDGSDRLSMSVAKYFPSLHRYAEQHKLLLIGEGDRFMNKTFIELFNPVILLIQGTGKEGRELRGSEQSERQLKTIQTRIKNVKPIHHVFTNSTECYDFLKVAIKECTYANA